MRLTTKQLKWFTSAMIIVCIALMLGWSTIVGERPGPSQLLVETKRYAVRVLTYLGIIVLALLFSGMGAIAVMRRTAAEYREAQMQNMQDLLEATKADHARKAGEDVRETTLAEKTDERD